MKLLKLNRHERECYLCEFSVGLVNVVRRWIWWVA
jgi:hypothetical protein